MSEPTSLRNRSASRVDALLREAEGRLRRQNNVLVDLARRASLHAGNLAEALREIASAAAPTLDVGRFSVWFFTADRRAIRCVELFDREQHASGGEIHAAAFPVYFRALESERTITADDANLDPRTSAFAEASHHPFGVTSLLDAPVRRLGQTIGVVCFEHTGPQRAWTVEEENFASSIADLVAMAVDAQERRQTQEALRHRVDFEKLVASISSRFVNLAPEEVDRAIRETLEAIATFVGAERGHVFMLAESGDSAKLTYEWSAPGVALRADAYGELPTAAFPWWVEQLRRSDIINVTTLDDLPPEAINERRLFARHGILSAVFVPMVVKKTLVGSVGCSSVTREMSWSEETIALLRIAGEIFVSALERGRALRALRASEMRHRMLFERNLAGVYRNGVDGRILECNEALAEMLGFPSKDEFMRNNARDLYFDPSERERFIEQLRRHGGIRNREVRLRHRAGHPIWLLESVHIVPAENGDEILEGTVIDITDRKLAETALRESEARYRLMAENSTDLISRTTGRGAFLYASDAVRSLLGYEPSELVGRSVFEFVDRDDHYLIRRFTDTLQESPRSVSYRAIRKDGTRVWFETTSRAIAGDDGAIAEIVSVSRDVSERRRAEEQIEYQAYHDALTGLPNRLLFRDRLTIALAHAKRKEMPLAVMFLDLDRFKYVNDTLGHSLGDELLRAIASRLRSVLRDGDTIARMGGDEFTILLADLQQPSDAAKIAQKLLEVVAQPVRVEGHELYVTTSIGIALFPNDGDTAETLLKSADSAMYRAKESGRSSYQLCTATMNLRAAERLSVEGALRRALDRDELVLYYQPLVHVATRQVAGVEALLRWNRPGSGVVPPATFIDIAEETRMIVPIGEWVLREACRQAKEWQKRGTPSLRVAVNLSPRQFQQSDLCDVVQRALDESGLAAHFLELEITETTAMMNTERSIATLADLRTLGVRIALDDFGTGHSSLSYLRRFPIDRVKIDREFIQDLEHSRSNRAIVASVVSMAHGLDLAVTAEGVETEEQVGFLRDQKCEEVQGYLFGRPVPPEQNEERRTQNAE
ncbi:MAG: EAL domain-containing protein [Acidobacteria bacterium]|nr:EAL domain-containing protein [Acidobacteriota bacterium]MBV9478424.1 EAL domain-containing protein [Acidobacteriota bacterium]